jgi:hypothetical protein
MKGIKIYLGEELERRFRKVAMEIYGYGRGSISRAAEDAIRRWVIEREELLREVRIPEDPIKAIKGMLKHVKKSGVELQHEAQQIRAGKIEH